MKNNKIYSLISLCARARRLCSGNFSVEKAVKNQSAYVVIVAKDASDNTKKLFDQKCNYYGIPYYEYGTKDELGKYSGNEMRTSIAILDEGFGNQIIGLVICLMLYSRCTIQEHEHIREFLKIYLNPLVRVIACNIVIHSKC